MERVTRSGGGVLLFACTIGATVLGAQRVFVNPHPEEHLRALFPKAVAFSPRTGDPPVFKAYAVDPKTEPDADPIGYAFWTPELVPDEHGYHGPIHLIVGMDRSGILTGVIVDYHSEPYGYFSVELPEFPAQFKGKSVRDQFKPGTDIAHVSRASLTISSAARAVRDSARMVARAYLDPAAVRK
ncbi:MAG: FMN-binding protein [Vicinamibacterales bacterium]